MAAVDPDCLTDEQWARLSELMPGGCKGKRGPRTDNRLFMDAVLWMARAGARWHDLPERLARISHTNRLIGSPNQRKLLCHNDFAQVRGAPDADRV
jgi:transposase